MIEAVRIIGLGPLVDLKFALTPLHALTGPDDSGKTTVLDAPRLVAGAPNVDRGLAARAAVSYIVDGKRGEVRFDGTRFVDDHAASAPVGALFLAFEPRALAKPCPPLADDAALGFDGPEGSGLAAIFHALGIRDPKMAAEIGEGICSLFPHFEALGVAFRPDGDVELQATLIGGLTVSGAQLGHGLLFSLAYTLVPLLPYAPLLLIDDIERGLHPARVRMLLAWLRDLSADRQVILTTRSPVVLDELEGLEVTLLSRLSENGPVAVRLCDTANYEARRLVYSHGQMWLEYCDGLLDADLIYGPGSAG